MVRKKKTGSLSGSEVSLKQGGEGEREKEERKEFGKKMMRNTSSKKGK